VRIACCIAGHLEVEHRIAVHHIQAPRRHVAHDLHGSYDHTLTATHPQYQDHQWAACNNLVSHMPRVHTFICSTYQGTKAAVDKLRQDLLPLNLAELPMQARNLHATCLQLELRVLQMHDGKEHIRLAESGE
jgi:hypothetical protein